MAAKKSKEEPLDSSDDEEGEKPMAKMKKQAKESDSVKHWCLYGEEKSAEAHFEELRCQVNDFAKERGYQKCHAAQEHKGVDAPASIAPAMRSLVRLSFGESNEELGVAVAKPPKKTKKARWQASNTGI